MAGDVSASPTPSARAVILTGSTGNLGVYLLDGLRALPGVHKIYCLNRSDDAATRQAAAHAARGVAATWTEAEVGFLTVDFGAPRLGLAPADWARLARDVDLIVHNAWPVDFNRHFRSFEPSIRGVQSLVALSRVRRDGDSDSDGDSAGAGNGDMDMNMETAMRLDRRGEESKARKMNDGAETPHPTTTPIPILFISSIGAVSNWGSHAPTARAQVPEEELTDWKLSRTGYGQSKLLSERLLAHAARTAGVPVAVARVGQLSGPVQRGTAGAWPAREWVPSLLRSARTLGVLPGDLGPSEAVDWVPVDLAARVLVELGAHVADLGVNGDGGVGGGVGMDDQHPRDAPRGKTNWLGGALKSKSTSKSKTKDEALFYHVVNPTPIRWADLVPTIRRHMPATVRTVSFVEWVEALQRSAMAGKGNARAGGTDEAGENATGNGNPPQGNGEVADATTNNPAAKLLDFFEHLQDRALRFPKSKSPALESRRTVAVSPTLARLGPVRVEWMDLWLRQWGWE